MFAWLEWFASECPNYNVQLYSCSKNSKINNFLTYVNYLDVIKKCDSKTDLDPQVKRDPEATD